MSKKREAPGEILELFKGGYLSVAETIAALDDLIPTPAATAGSAVAMREALKPFANISLIRDADPGALNDMIDGPDLAITPKDVRRARAALAAAPQAQEGEREVLIHECAAIADKYDDCGGAFIAQKIRDLLAVSRPQHSPIENTGE